MIKNLKNKKKGFTLIELIIVIAIIAILAAVAIPKFGQIRRDANLKSDIANAKTIANAASALIAEGKIVPVTTTITPIVIGPEKNNTADTATIAEKATVEIENYLQNVPTPQSKGKTGTVYSNYNVSIDSNGTVTVYLGNSSEANVLFPTQATSIE